MSAFAFRFVIRFSLDNPDEWVPITNNNNAPHSDTRGLVFSPDGTCPLFYSRWLVCPCIHFADTLFFPGSSLTIATDGGLYMCPNPRAPFTDVVWTPKIGTMENLQCNAGGFDPFSGIAVCGAQDNGNWILRPGGSGPNFYTGDRFGDGAFAQIISETTVVPTIRTEYRPFELVFVFAFFAVARSF